MSLATPLPIATDDPTNAAILRVSEDRLQGFQPEPFREVARRSGVPVGTVLERVRAMLEAGVIRRVRQTVLSTSLAPGALVAWRVPAEGLERAFEFMAERDPFSGHVVVRSTDAGAPGADYRLWDDAQGAAGVLDAEARGAADAADARNGFQADAGEADVHAGRGACAAAVGRAGGEE